VDKSNLVGGVWCGEAVSCNASEPDTASLRNGSGQSAGWDEAWDSRGRNGPSTREAFRGGRGQRAATDRIGTWEARQGEGGDNSTAWRNT